jgi:predicted  nucleic acid-binding Zn-ribbon protein
MVDADSVLANVRERDKWVRRMETLERSLDELHTRRVRQEAHLRRVRKEMARIQVTLDAVLDAARTQGNPGKFDGSQRIPLNYR